MHLMKKYLLNMVYLYSDKVLKEQNVMLNGFLFCQLPSFALKKEEKKEKKVD